MNIKHLIILLSAGVLSACNKPNTIQFDVKVPGMTDGTFVIKDIGQKIVFGENVVNGACAIKNIMDTPGFYTLDIVENGNSKTHIPFEVYLEPAKYTVTALAGKLERYPQIETDSKKQQEVNNYNKLYDELGGELDSKILELNKQLESAHNLSMDERKQLMIKISNAEDKKHDIQYTALEKFIKKYPESELSAHFMLKQNYEAEPVKYAKLFDGLNAAAKNSDEGKEVSKTLARATQLLPGHKAPDIAGKTFNGKTFGQITAGKKIFLIDFWRSANRLSRENHEKMNSIYSIYGENGLEIISVSLDSKPLWWATAVKDDKLPWPQMSDLKGNDSPNAANWAITTIPTYYLVDADWKIYKRDIALSSILLEVRQYLEKHP